MERQKKTMPESVLLFGTTQPVGTRRRFADLVIGGLLVVVAIGGFAM
jgi:hypothetical protein